MSRDSDTTFKVKRSRSQGAGIYCGGLPPTACLTRTKGHDGILIQVMSFSFAVLLFYMKVYVTAAVTYFNMSPIWPV